VIVVDASAALSALLNDGSARQALAAEQLHAPHLIDSEVASGLRRAVAAGHIEANAGWTALDTWRRLGLTRYAVHPLLDRVWELRDNVTAYDAGYVALAESLNCALITADAKLSHAPGIRCPVTVMPR
jgi:predicted nucleic acid-binding protein